MRLLLLVTSLTLVLFNPVQASVMDQLCGNKFFRQLHAKFNFKSSAQKKIDIFDKSFDLELAYPMLEKLDRDARANFLSDLAKMADSDIVFNHNFTELVNKAIKNGDVDVVKLQKLNNKFQGNSFFYFDKSGKKLQSKLNLHPEELAIVESTLSKLTDLPVEKKLDLQNTLLQSGYSADELIQIEKAFIKLNSKNIDLDQLESFILYTNTLKKGSRAKTIMQVEQVFNGNAAKSDEINRFFKREKKLDQFEARKFEKLKKEYASENGGELPERLLKRASTEAKVQRQIYQRLYYGCKSKSSSKMSFSDRELLSSKRRLFQKFATLSTIPMGITGFAIADWDKPKDLEWFSRVGYEIGMGMLLNSIAANFSSNIDSSFLKKIFQSYVFEASTDVADSSIYGSLFGISNKEVEEKFQEIFNDPDFTARLKQLEQYIEKEGWLGEFKHAMSEYFNLQENNQPLELDKLTLEDLETEEARDFILELIARELYYEEAGELIVSGNTTLDRYTYYRMYDLIQIPRGILIATTIFRVLCTSASPAKGMALSMGILLANRLIVKPMDYRFRNWAISQ